MTRCIGHVLHASFMLLGFN